MSDAIILEELIKYLRKVLIEMNGTRDVKEFALDLLIKLESDSKKIQ